jgi:hypothetical protein
VIDWECTCQIWEKELIPAKYANKILKIIYKQLKFKVKMENESNKQTAVEWLLNQISINGFKQDIKQALQMDKEQKKDAWEDGMRSDHGFFGTFEQYYEQTYGGNNGE